MCDVQHDVVCRTYDVVRAWRTTSYVTYDIVGGKNPDDGFFFVPNMSKLSKSEPTYPHSILMQKSKDMREKNIEPEI